MNPERQRFRCLVRHFAYRFVDHELVAGDCDIHQTLVNVLALLASLSFLQALSLILKYFFAVDGAPEAARQMQLWIDQEFLISLVMTAVGFFAVLGWDALFPDRRDAMSLGALGVRPGTELRARLCSIALFLGLIILGVVSFVAISFPFQIAGPFSPFPKVVHAFFANLVTLAAAGSFSFLAFFALRGIMVLALSYPLQQRFSAWIQTVAMIALLLGLFLLPNPSVVRLGPAWVGACLPSYWFLSLEQHLLGAPQPLPWDLGSRALVGLGGTAAVAFFCFAFGYRRALRKAAEQGELSPARHGWLPERLAALVGRFVVPKPRERAAFLFTARTMLRSRRHRLLLGVYCAVGLAYVGVGLSHFLRHGAGRVFEVPTPALTSIPLDLAFALLLGARVLFSVPVELKSNWIFRMNQDGKPEDYLSGVRKYLLVLAALPLALAPLPVFTALWGTGPALRHSLFFLLIVAFLTELMMGGLRKIPFTCSMIPGNANLKVRLPAYFILFAAVSYCLAMLDTHYARSPGAFLVQVGAGALAYAALRWKRSREAGGWEFQWEERPVWFTRLDLAR